MSDSMTIPSRAAGPWTYARTLLAAAAALSVSCASEHAGEGANGHAQAATQARHGRPDHAAVPIVTSPDVIDAIVPPRTQVLATYPCMEQCHKEREPDAAARELTEFHSLKEFQHGDTTFWCNFCHNLENFDTLRLLDGRVATFDESYRVCGQCHGDKRRDWQLGIHGLQTGYWNGDRTRRSCTACHDPHSPRRPTFEALPAPRARKGSP